LVNGDLPRLKNVRSEMENQEDANGEACMNSDILNEDSKSQREKS